MRGHGFAMTPRPCFHGTSRQCWVALHLTQPTLSPMRAPDLSTLLTVVDRGRVGSDRQLGAFVPGYEASGWFGLGAPRNTPGEIVEAINKEINAILKDEKVKARLADLGGTPLVGTPADFGKLIAVESEKWAKVVKFSGAKPG